jgi:hypothetical protein
MNVEHFVKLRLGILGNGGGEAGPRVVDQKVEPVGAERIA